jgi:hypothetical protein
MKISGRQVYRQKQPSFGPGKENMSELIDAKGLGCAQPVILARMALELNDEITVVVDERTALENLKLLAMHVGYLGIHMKCLVDVTAESGNIYWICLRKTGLDGKRRLGIR